MEYKQANAGYASVGYQAAVGTAIVAGVFALVIAALLGMQAYHYTVSDAADAEALEKMKEQAKAYPADETLSQDVLQLDTQLRRSQLARVQFLKRGTWLLIGTLALGIGALLWARGHLRKMLVLPAPADIKAEQVLHAQQIRTGVTAALVVLAGGTLFWSLHSPGENVSHANKQSAAQQADEAAQVEDSSYASMDEMEAQWPTFRGPGGLGVSRSVNIPTEWDAPGGKNIVWKTPVPLNGNSSPVVWGKKVFVTGATAEKQQVYCFDADTGTILWTGDVTVPDDPARADMNIGEDTGYAASSPVTDGRRVCAIFAGGDIGCFTVDGKTLWQKHFGIPDSLYGYASSLTAFENLVIVQWDVGSEPGLSKLTAVDWRTGETAWQTERPVPNSWSSPTVVKTETDTYRILTAASPYVIAYDPKSGSEVFRAECIHGDIAATPVYADGKVFTMEPYQKLVAIKTEGASGDVTSTHIAWQADGSMPDICSPLSDGTFVWTLGSDGNLSCYKSTDGSEIYTQSLQKMFQASPVLAAGTLYLLAQDGTMILAEAAGQYKEITRNALGEDCVASPAFAEARIYVRGKQNLYCIGTPE